MKTVILCGGVGTRLTEETHLKPKPMVEIGERPILWHIMKIFSHFGYNDFVLALGYKGEVIKEFFLNYYALTSDLTVHLRTGKVEFANCGAENWAVQMVDTGKESMTGGRLRRLEGILKDEGSFMLTYGDGVADIDINELVNFHKRHGKLATVTAVRPPSRFGAMVIDEEQVVEFMEKPQSGEGWISGGFFVFNAGVFDYIRGDATVLEREPLEHLAQDGQLMTFKHQGFWMCMDTLRDKRALEAMWSERNALWKVWD
jgi:glucose-1-phosphate cytidylyltransferase